MQVLGMMSGTSLDAVDFAVLKTDGITVAEFGPSGERKLPSNLRNLCLAATRLAATLNRGDAEPEIFETASRSIAEFQAGAVRDFLRMHDLDGSGFVAIGFHGQTVLHRRPEPGRMGHTIQLGDAATLARDTGIPVVHNLRAADVANGGQGAPLAPVYHAALTASAGLARPVAVLNLGGVGNITFVGSDGDLVAFDTGPANGPLDQLAERAGLGRFDEGGRLALCGRPDEDRITRWLAHPYFEIFGPKSLDRYEFTPDLVDDLAPEDAAATLSAFAAAAVGHAIRLAPVKPTRLIVCGGGRYNVAIMNALAERAGVPVGTAEDVGWAGDAIEAQAWAFLAARSLRGLPISFPGTTGVAAPLPGGELVRAA